MIAEPNRRRGPCKRPRRLPHAGSRGSHDEGGLPIGERGTDISALAGELPDISFATTTTPAEMAREIAVAVAVLVACRMMPRPAIISGADKFAVMKQSAFVINVARGDIIDEAILIEAGRSGRIAGTGLDVCARGPLPPESELWTLDRLFLWPHIGAGGDDEREALFAMIGENLRL